MFIYIYIAYIYIYISHILTRHMLITQLTLLNSVALMSNTGSFIRIRSRSVTCARRLRTMNNDSHQSRARLIKVSWVINVRTTTHKQHKRRR